MNKIKHFPTFHFYPLKLKEVSEKIQEKYKDDSELPINIVRTKLPNLLARIRELSQELAEVRSFADSLKPIDINVLASGYPYEQENKNTISKIMIILLHRYNRIVGRRFWRHLQTSPHDSRIYEMLIYVFEQEDASFLGLKQSIRDQYNKMFTVSKVDIAFHMLATQIDSGINRIEESFKDWKIENNSMLANELWLLILEYQMNTVEFVELQDAEILRDKLNDINLKRYKQIIVNYLDALKSEEYDHLLFTQLINRLYDPRRDLSRWNNVSKDIITKVKQRLIRVELYDFFDSDSERFSYWAKYINYVNDVEFIEDPPIAAMYFGEFVVVEFADKGNAAYFYEQKGFAEHLAHKIRRKIYPSELKALDADYYIHKLSHTKKWHSRYDRYMVSFLNGDLNYKE